jgi:predicted amidohydrolase
MAISLSTSDSINVLAVQTSVPQMTTSADRDAHTIRVAGMIDGYVKTHAESLLQIDLVVLPELSSIEATRPAFECLEQIGEPLDGFSYSVFGPLAKEHKLFIAYGIARRDERARDEGDDGVPSDPANYYICHVVVGPDGLIVGHYDKMHICQFGSSVEKDFFQPGDHFFTFQVRGFKVSIVICYDFRFAKALNRLAWDLDVDLLLHPVAFHRDSTFAIFHTCAKVRAMENQIYWLSVNRAGAEYGHSLFSPPLVTDESPVQTMSEHAEQLHVFQVTRKALVAAHAELSFRIDARDYDKMPVSSGDRLTSEPCNAGSGSGEPPRNTPSPPPLVVD